MDYIRKVRKSILHSTCSIKSRKSSEPDFIINKNINDQIVIDAKWKVPSSFTNIQYEDVAKLKRDCILRETLNGILIYPELPSSNNGSWYFDDDKNFKFKLIECNVFHYINMESL